MNKELLILRHGKSDWGQDLPDFDRPLKDRGKRGAQRMGVWLAQQGLQPDLVLTSPAERAATSAEKCCKAMGGTSAEIRRDQRLYAAGASQLLTVLRELPETAQRVLLVGHNPGLEEFLLDLVDGEVPIPDDGKLLPTATLARLELSCDWLGLASGCARLHSITRAASLPKKFPFPNPKGSELRDRPAYYYEQSSAIPYRVRGGKPEILITSSSQQKHWVVPKGIREPGLSPEESAAREAREEAGVEGQVEELLGSYRYAKWGAECRVAVYPLRVTQVIAKALWDESHRGRRWVSPKKAARRLNQPELKPLVKRLVKRLAKRRKAGAD